MPALRWFDMLRPALPEKPGCSTANQYQTQHSDQQYCGKLLGRPGGWDWIGWLN